MKKFTPFTKIMRIKNYGDILSKLRLLERCIGKKTLLGLVVSLTLCTHGHAQRFSTPPQRPTGAYSKYFKYYTMGDDAMPTGTASARDALMLIMGNIVEDGHATRFVNGGTGFLIWTERKDGKICMCTAAHVMEDWLKNTASRYTLGAYMKYMTQPSTDPNLVGHDEAVSSFVSTIHPELVASSIGWGRENLDGDWALMLVDPQELPVADFAERGYVFNPTIYSSSAQSFFIMGHPYYMGQRIADSLQYVNDRARQYDAASPYFMLDNPPGKISGMGPAASGAPVINNFIAGAPVTGIYWGRKAGTPGGTIESADVLPNDLQNRFSTEQSRRYTFNGFSATKMSHPTLMAAIKRHCWPREDSAQIERTQRYEQSVSMSLAPSVAQFDQDRSITSQAEIATAADQHYGANNPGQTLVKANTLTINCQLTPGPTLPVLYGLAREIKLDAGFSYTASGNYQMEMNSAVPETGSIIAHKRTKGNGTTDTTGKTEKHMVGFSVYPNPSASGLFNIVCPATSGAYRIAVHSADGRQVHSLANITVEKYLLNLSTLPRGAYVLSIYQQQTGERIFSKTIVY